jgi:mono/diheme cytochrome c family protein
LRAKRLASDRPVSADTITDFDVLFDKNCVGCHGPGGQGGAAPPLATPLYLALADAPTIAAIVADGIPGTSMPPFSQKFGGSLTDQQIGLIADGMVSRWAHPEQFEGVEIPPIGTPTAAPDGGGDAGRGAAAFQVFCARCHGADGRGGPDGRSVVDPAYLGLTSDYGLRATIVVGRPDLGMPDWRGDAPGRAMTAEEISDITAWLRSQQTQR